MAACSTSPRRSAITANRGSPRGKRTRLIALRLLFYPGVAFLKLYLGKRYFLNGWAGFFAAKTQAFYAFLKYAKVLEAQRQSRG